MIWLLHINSFYCAFLGIAVNNNKTHAVPLADSKCLSLRILGHLNSYVAESSSFAPAAQVCILNPDGTVSFAKHQHSDEKVSDDEDADSIELLPPDDRPMLTVEEYEELQTLHCFLTLFLEKISDDLHKY